ncbi:hypothetical protein CEXT_688401 [Caerostris extrusa]|uniref:Ycf1 n=1 Tax=Caerostris extrusa TaxID=172846 RepID=A0AAV4SYJ1_CAEEX|nr:hypothetical protein CEXT_688401 [Caerostris extrusa]
MLDILKNHWSPSFGKLEDFSAVRKVNKLNDLFRTNISSRNDSKYYRLRSKSSTKFALISEIRKKKEEIESLKNEASSTLKIEQIEEEIEVCEESLKSTENDLLRYIFSPPVQEDFKRFIVELIKQEKEYHVKDKRIFSNLKEIMLPKLGFQCEEAKSIMHLRNEKILLYRLKTYLNDMKEESQSLEKSKKPGRFTAVEKTSGKFYSSDIKSAQPNLSIDSPSTSGGIGVYHSDNLLPSTPTKKLFDDKKSEDTGDFVRFVTEDISL